MNGTSEEAQPDNLTPVFQRFSQASRMVLYRARQMFSTYPTTNIEPPHILLGALRQDQDLFRPYLKPDRTIEQMKSVLIQQVAPTGTRSRIPEHIEVPFAPSVRASLLASAVIASELESKSIEPSHVLLALIENVSSPATDMLTDAGVTADAILAKLKGPRP